MSHARAYYKHIGTSHSNFHVLFSIKFIWVLELWLLLFFRSRGTWVSSPLSVIRSVCISNVSAAGFSPVASISIIFLSLSSDTLLLIQFRCVLMSWRETANSFFVHRNPQGVSVCTLHVSTTAMFVYSQYSASREFYFWNFAKNEQKSSGRICILSIWNVLLLLLTARRGREFCVLVFWRVHYARFVLLWLFLFLNCINRFPLQLAGPYDICLRLPLIRGSCGI